MQRRVRSSWRQLHPWTQRTVLVLAALVALMLLAGGLGYRALWQHYADSQQQLDARMTRLDGILKSGADIQQQLQASSAQLQPWLHDGSGESESEILRQLRALVEASGTTLLSSQTALIDGADAAPSQRSESGDDDPAALAHVRISIAVSGEWPALMELATALQTQQPPLWLHSATLRAEASRREGGQAARLSLQLDAPLGSALPSGGV